MRSPADPGFIGDLPPRRRSAQPAPLDIWVRTLLIVLLLVAGASAWVAFGHTPMPVRSDSVAFTEKLTNLRKRLRQIRGKGESPISMVLIGTSRLRNVALDSSAMADAAREAGIERPLATTVLGVNWGGFERLAPALPMIEQLRPDVLVVMPEFVTEDFTPAMRLRMGAAWLQRGIWGKGYNPFPADEISGTVCNSAESPAERFARGRSYIRPDPDGRGPRLAHAFLRRMATAGTQVYIADVPVSPELAALRPPSPKNWPSPAALGLRELRIRGIPLTGRIDRNAYCDHAHLDPLRAAAWRGPFFDALVDELNALPH